MKFLYGLTLLHIFDFVAHCRFTGNTARQASCRGPLYRSTLTGSNNPCTPIQLPTVVYCIRCVCRHSFVYISSFFKSIQWCCISFRETVSPSRGLLNTSQLQMCWVTSRNAFKGFKIRDRCINIGANPSAWLSSILVFPSCIVRVSLSGVFCFSPTFISIASHGGIPWCPPSFVVSSISAIQKSVGFWTKSIPASLFPLFLTLLSKTVRLQHFLVGASIP